MAEILSKSAYARQRGRGPSAVSNWIRSGQLSPPALLPDGRINVELADLQLAERLDPVRSAAQRSSVGSNTGSSDPAKVARAEYLRASALSAAVRAERERRELYAERGRTRAGPTTLYSFSGNLKSQSESDKQLKCLLTCLVLNR